MKKKNILILVLILVVLAGAGIGGFFLIRGQMTEKVYKEKMSEGRKYLSQMRYEEAAAAFEFALEKNPDDETVYISLYRVHVAMGDMDEAARILQLGYSRLESERLYELLSSCMEKAGNLQTEDETGEIVENLEVNLEDITMNTVIVQKLEKYNYSSYTKEFGRYTSNEMSGNSLEITHGKIEAVFVYQNRTGEGKVINSAQKLPKENAKPAYIQLKNVGLLFRNFESGITFERLQEIVGTKVICEYSDEAGSYVDFFSFRNCEIQIACKENGDIVSLTAWNKIIPPEGTEENGKVPVDGVIINAVTGKGLDGAELSFEPKERGLDSVQTETDRTGSFSTELEPGNYEVEVSKDGFITDSFELEVEENTPVSGISFPLSPELAMGEIRIVLTWNAYPSDLDSHLSGRTPSGRNFELYFGRRDISDGNTPVASLDVDETGGFGPETTTIYVDGDYHFWVEDFTHTGEMSGSGAQVKVYLSDQGAPEVFDVPSGSGNVWDVFTIENGTIRPINKITE